ncbi:MAG: alpha/beta fold hydrolase [Acidimicrobiales bacterium]
MGDLSRQGPPPTHADATTGDVNPQRSTTAEGDEHPLRVRSPDGTEIACWQTGDGPPLVLVHGAPADHTRWRPVLPYLEPHFTVYTLDRRGRGASTDSPDYTLEREFEDVAAVVDDVAASNASTVTVYGHSFGGNVAFGAATMTSNIDRLVLYEGWPIPDPSVWALPADLEARMNALLAEGDRDAVVELLFRELEDLSDEDIAAFKTAPSWLGRVAAAPTITREIRGLMTSRLDVEIARTIIVPVLLVIGEHSVDLAQPHAAAVAEVLPKARVLVLEDQEHVADVLDPASFTQRVLPFLKGDS